MAGMFPTTQILYRNYPIRKKPFPPSIIFYIFKDDINEIHILRVLREERNWHKLLTHSHYNYPV